MSTVIPTPMAMIAGLITLVIGGQVGAPAVLVGPVAVLVAAAVGAGWTWSDRLPNGRGPL